MKHAARLMALLTAGAALLLLGGCGGEGGGGGGGGGSDTSTTLSGVAAAGAPIVGTVTVKDSSSPAETKTVLIEADGSYNVDVSDMTGPFALRADGHVGGHEYHLYSAATEADVGGTINVTPFTDLIIANIAGDIAANYFDSGNFSDLTANQITAAEADLQAKLQPILTAAGLDASIDLLRTAFSADHTELDGVLDVVRVTVDPDTKVADIVNVITDNSVSVDVTTGNYTGDFTADDGTAVQEGLTDLQKIVAGFDTFTALFATSLPQEDAPALLALFDQQGFLHDGMGLAQFLSDPTSDPSLTGIKFTNVTVVSLDPGAGTGEVGFDVVLGGKTQTDAPNRFKMIRKTPTGPWLMQGNRHLLRTEVEVRAWNWPKDSRMATGFDLQVRDDGGQSGVDYVIVRGLGLDSNLVPGGVVLVKVIEDDEFTMWDGGQINPYNHQIQMDDATVESIPEWGAEYTFTLWSANGTEDPSDDVQLDVANSPYRFQLRARPYNPSELSAANFPQITAPSLTAWETFDGGVVNVTWTIPAGCWSDFVYIYLWGPEGSADGEKMVAPSATSTSLTVLAETGDGTPITLQNRNLEVGVLDDGGRQLTTTLY